MNYRLTLHADSTCPSVDRIDVSLSRQHSRLALRYNLAGTISDLKVPEPDTPARADGLWRHTCFELFLGTTASDEYCEFNFSPSTRWAAYRFKRYRDGMALMNEIEIVTIETSMSGGLLKLNSAIDLATFALRGALRIGLSAIVEESRGRISYWALAHPPGKPDFHHGASFVPLADSLS